MDVFELLRAYTALPQVEQGMFAAMIRAHQVFNSPEWKAEIARRHHSLDAGREVDLPAIEALIRNLDSRTA